MKKYIAQTVFEISAIGTVQTEFDIQYRLVLANDAYSALLKALSHAKKQEGSVTPMEGPDLFWKFIGITDLFPVDEVEDGGELFTQTHQTCEPAHYVQFVKQRTMAMQAKNLTFV